MTTRDFCYWLQGYFEVRAASAEPGNSLSTNQVEAIKRHLSMVFAHDIDPKAGDAAHQHILNMIHDGQKVVPNSTPRC